jgi:hypothetical protein
MTTPIQAPRCPECQSYLDVEESARWVVNRWRFDAGSGTYTQARTDGEWEHSLVCPNPCCTRQGQSMDEWEGEEGMIIANLLLEPVVTSRD